MIPDEFVEQLQQVIPGRLQSAVLYGSAAAGEFVPGTSNYNVLLVVDRLGMAELNALSEMTVQWAKEGNRPPLLFTRKELLASADVFPIELLDIRQSYRVLFGTYPLADLAIRPEHLRLQLERELKEKLLALRERYVLAAGKPARVLDLLASSVVGFLVLFRAALRLFQEDVPARKVDALRLLTQHIAFDPRPLLEVDQLKHGRRDPQHVVPEVLFESFLTAIEQIIDAVDRRLHP
jgi:hypothetical protein